MGRTDSSSTRRRTRRRLALAGLGAGAVAATVATLQAGRRAGAARDPEVEPLLTPPPGVLHHHIATGDGGSLHVAEMGRGRPVVLLHGVTLQWWVWSALFHLLGTDHRVLAWDMRGHGESRPGDDGVTLEAVADDLALVLEHFDCQDAVVVGHSMGGMALGRFCLDHPHAHDRVGHLVFLATSASALGQIALAPGSLAESGLVRAASVGFGGPLRLSHGSSGLTRAAIRVVFGRRYSTRAVDDVQRMVAEMSPVPLLSALRSIARHDVLAELTAVDLPTTVVTGTRDVLTPPHHARALAGAVGGSTLHLLDGVGHQVMQEVPEDLAIILRGLPERAARDSGLAASAN